MEKLQVRTRTDVYAIRLAVRIVKSPQSHPSVIADFLRGIETRRSRAARSTIIVDKIGSSRAVASCNAVGVGDVAG